MSTSSDADMSNDVTDDAHSLHAILDGAAAMNSSASLVLMNHSAAPAAHIHALGPRGSPLLAVFAGLIFVAAVSLFRAPLHGIAQRAPLALRRHMGGRSKGRYSSLSTDEMT